MAPRDRVSPPFVGPRDRASSVQHPLVFETSQDGRNEAALLNALTKALARHVGTAAREPALQESFLGAAAGLGAEKGVLMWVSEQDPLDVEILFATGVHSED